MDKLSGLLRIATVFGVREETVGPHTRFRSRRVEALYRWWMDAGKGEVPRWTAFDITEHRDLIPNAFAVRVLSGGEFLMTLHGEEVIHLFGGNNTGRLVLRQEEVSDYVHALSG